MYDVFISYAHEDSDYVVVLANRLKKLGLSVWIDIVQLKVGDSIIDGIADGIKKSKFALVVLSEYYLKKQWPIEELKALFQTQLSSKQRMILPIWHGISKDDIEEHFPFLLDIKALITQTMTVSAIAAQIYKVAKEDNDEVGMDSKDVSTDTLYKTALYKTLISGKIKKTLNLNKGGTKK